MIYFDLLRNILGISIIVSSITCTFVQKTKGLFNSSKYLTIYSFIVNLISGILFCLSFTDINFPQSLWIGLFSFIGADSLYKSLEGRIAPYSKLKGNDSSTQNNL